MQKETFTSQKTNLKLTRALKALKGSSSKSVSNSIIFLSIGSCKCDKSHTKKKRSYSEKLKIIFERRGINTKFYIR